jgi:hypothetical protein
MPISSTKGSYGFGSVNKELIDKRAYHKSKFNFVN